MILARRNQTRLHGDYKIDGTARKDHAHARLYDAGDGCPVVVLNVSGIVSWDARKRV